MKKATLTVLYLSVMLTLAGCGASRNTAQEEPVQHSDNESAVVEVEATPTAPTTPATANNEQDFNASDLIDSEEKDSLSETGGEALEVTLETESGNSDDPVIPTEPAISATTTPTENPSVTPEPTLTETPSATPKPTLTDKPSVTPTPTVTPTAVRRTDEKTSNNGDAIQLPVAP